jgi:hypothetical protein
MPCQAMHPIQDLFLEGFSYVLQIDINFICTPMWTKFYSCKKFVLHVKAPIFNVCMYIYMCVCVCANMYITAILEEENKKIIARIEQGPSGRQLTRVQS